MKSVTRERPIKVYHPKEVGWYWYQATPEEMETLTVVSDQVVEIRLTKEGVLMTEFVRECRSVAKLNGKWSEKLSPSYRE